MDKWAMTRLRNGRQITYCYPDSHMMAAVCAGIFAGNDYPTLPFLDPTIVLDVGANIGCTALLFANTYGNAKIYSLEPASEAFSYLSRNTAALPSVKAFQIGAFDRDAQPILHLGSEASVTNSIAPGIFTGQRQEQITVRRFSSFLAEQGITHISILKLDTEGAELAILRDIASMLDRIDCIMVEYHSEGDRFALDELLKSRFTLYACKAEHPHRGAYTYVSSEIIRTRTPFENFIIRPIAV
jgi:FkbM family methyltransferase